MVGAMAEEKSKTGHRHRLRERFIQGEETSRNEETLLELLLTYAIPQQDVQPLARHLLGHFGSLSKVIEADPKALSRFDGLKDNAAILLKLVDWIRKYYQTTPADTDRSNTKDYQLELFEPVEKLTEHTSKEPICPAKPSARAHPAKVRRGTGLFTNDLLRESIEILPRLPDTTSIMDIKKFLWNNLPFNSYETRERYGQYVVLRMFPQGTADQALLNFARYFSGRPELRDVCFYRFCKAEPLMYRILEEVLLPQIVSGNLEKARLKYFLVQNFPESKSYDKAEQAIVRVLTVAQIARLEKHILQFAYREIPLAAFAFILHSEFPEPGIYPLEQMEENRAIRNMFWNPDRLLPMLYELRNQGLISKVTEIDRVRQFGTNFTLEEVVQKLVKPI